MKLLIDDVEVNVEWEDNDSVNAIKELAKNGGLTINTHQYGGFEQVGDPNVKKCRCKIPTK